METVTKIKDVVVPELFTQYVIEKTAEKSRLLQSGIAVANPEINRLVTEGGKTMTMPFWADLTGDSEVLDDSKALTPGKIAAKADIATLLLRGRAWGSNDLAGALAGSDPQAAIGDRVADWWARDEQKILLSVLDGVFASTEMSDHILDKSTEKISPDMILDAKQLLGDSADQLTGIMMHSAVYTELQKQNVIQFVAAEGPSGSQIQIPSYLGYRIIVDDALKDAEGVYTAYLFARGVIARGDGTPVSMVMTETDRDSLAGEDYLINRRALVLHPYGIKWKGSPAGSTPTNEELKEGGNWERVYESKNIGIVKVKFKITED